jgi:hypothetical protein
MPSLDPVTHAVRPWSGPTWKNSDDSLAAKPGTYCAKDGSHTFTVASIGSPPVCVNCGLDWGRPERKSDTVVGSLVWKKKRLPDSSHSYVAQTTDAAYELRKLPVVKRGRKLKEMSWNLFVNDRLIRNTARYYLSSAKSLAEEHQKGLEQRRRRIASRTIHQEGNK